jgi:hypothetical protein
MPNQATPLFLGNNGHGRYSQAACDFVALSFSFLNNLRSSVVRAMKTPETTFAYFQLSRECLLVWVLEPLFRKSISVII